MRPLWVGLLVLPLVWIGCRGGGREQEPVETAKMGEQAAVTTIVVTSAAFEPGARIPVKYTGEGENVSPPLGWSGAPEGTREFAVICDDPDAPRKDPWVHWVVYGIPADRRGFAEGDPGGATLGVTSARSPGYRGPMPPPGHGVHHYHFKVYALGAPLDLGPGASKQELLQAMEGHILAQGELVGTYER